jgi:hypothetical protein
VDEGDGLAYSYSVTIAMTKWRSEADRIVLMPAKRGNAPSRFHPLVNRNVILLF